MKKSRKKDELSFNETPEGQSPEAFKDLWYALPFGQQVGLIDTDKLYWNLTSYSEQGNTYKNWMAAARTFYLRYPHQYKITHGTVATQRAVEFNQSNQQVTESRGVEYFIPAHLRNDQGGY